MWGRTMTHSHSSHALASWSLSSHRVTSFICQPIPCVSTYAVLSSLTLTTVTSCMNYHFSMGYKFGFESPTHPGREHLCMLAEETAEKMQNRKRVQPVDMEPCHRVVTIINTDYF